MADKATKKERMILMPTLMPPSLIDAVDAVVAELGYVSRAEFQRDAAREKVARTHPHLLPAPVEPELETAA
jgi:metal-responsive CopG/Arc/MetJ family transcriptional regulator